MIYIQRSQFTSTLLDSSLLFLASLLLFLLPLCFFPDLVFPLPPLAPMFTTTLSKPFPNPHLPTYKPKPKPKPISLHLPISNSIPDPKIRITHTHKALGKSTGQTTNTSYVSKPAKEVRLKPALEMWTLCGLGYWVQGFRVFPWLGLNFHLAQGIGLNPGTLQLVQNISNLPMVGKPLFGVISDAVYIGDAHRLPYISIGG